MKQTSTQDGPIVPGDIVRADAVRMLHMLPPTVSKSQDLFRFIAMPSFNAHWFAVSLRRKSGADADGVWVVVTRKPGGKLEPGMPISFALSRDRYVRLAHTLDTLDDGYPGYVDSCLDGTLVAFERVRGTHVTSGTGNAGCNEHYHAISAAVLAELRQSVPASDLPSRPDWMMLK